MEISELQKGMGKYNDDWFPDNTDPDMILGVMEELGELAESSPVDGEVWKKLHKIMGKLSHHNLKRRQGIRGSEEEHTAKEKDAVGDLFNFLINYCNLRGFSLDEIATETLNHIETRKEGKRDGL